MRAVTAPVEPITDAPPDASANDEPVARERIARKMYRGVPASEFLTEQNAISDALSAVGLS